MEKIGNIDVSLQLFYLKNSYEDFVKLCNSFDYTIIARDHSNSRKICGMLLSGTIKTDLKENGRNIYILTVKYMMQHVLFKI